MTIAIRDVFCSRGQPIETGLRGAPSLASPNTFTLPRTRLMRQQLTSGRSIRRRRRETGSWTGVLLGLFLDVRQRRLEVPLSCVRDLIKAREMTHDNGKAFPSLYMHVL